MNNSCCNRSRNLNKGGQPPVQLQLKMQAQSHSVFLQERPIAHQLHIYFLYKHNPSQFAPIHIQISDTKKTQKQMHVSFHLTKKAGWYSTSNDKKAHKCCAISSNILRYTWNKRSNKFKLCSVLHLRTPREEVKCNNLPFFVICQYLALYSSSEQTTLTEINEF